MPANNSITPEIWKPVIGYEAIYSVSDRGAVRREMASPGARSGKLLAAFPNTDGYSIVGLYLNGKSRQFRVHCLVAAAFIGPCPSGKQVNHKDGNKSHNHVDNLEYTTPKENRQHASLLGLNAFGAKNGSIKHPDRLARGKRNGSYSHPERRPRGERHGQSRLNESQVREMRELHDQGEGLSFLAHRFGVCKSMVHNIVTGKNWSHI